MREIDINQNKEVKREIVTQYVKEYFRTKTQKRPGKILHYKRHKFTIMASNFVRGQLKMCKVSRARSYNVLRSFNYKKSKFHTLLAVEISIMRVNACYHLKYHYL